MSKIQAYFLVGPTASGKSQIAHRIALQWGAQILSADSMLVYRGMDIGTAKPTMGERSEVTYRGMDLTDPDRNFSVGEYHRYAGALAPSFSKLQKIIVVGGTGLYVKSLVDGLEESSGADPDVRIHWEQVLAEAGVAGLQKALLEKSRTMYESLADVQNPRRLIRALEWVAEGRQTPPVRRNSGVARAPLVGLQISPESLVSRIARRVEVMYASGFSDEVKVLRKRYPELSRTARQAIGYAEMMEQLDGNCSESDAKLETIRRTIRLAKRQRTWFRHQADVDWVPAENGDDPEALALKIQEKWERLGPVELNLEAG